MTKLILTASILSLLTAPALAAEEGFFSKLEQGVKAEANTQLQGYVGTSIKGTLPSSAQRIVKPAANELVKGAVDASSSAIKRNNVQNVAAQELTQAKDTEEAAKTPEPALSSPASTVPSTVQALLSGGLFALTAIPTPKVAPRFKRDCGAWIGTGTDCMKTDYDSLRRAFPDRKEHVAALRGVKAMQDEAMAWIAVYDIKTGEINMDKATEREMRNLGFAVDHTNKMLDMGFIHPDSLVFRDCIRQKKAMRPKSDVKTRADVCL